MKIENIILSNKEPQVTSLWLKPVEGKFTLMFYNNGWHPITSNSEGDDIVKTIEQSFTDKQKETVRNNIDAAPIESNLLETDSKNIIQAINEINEALGNYQPTEAGKGLSTNDYSDEEKNKVANALLKTEQSLSPEEIAQVQTNIGVKDTVDVVGVGEITDVPQEIAKDATYRGTDGTIKTHQYYFISNPYAVKRGDIIVGSITALKDIAVISRVSDTNEFLYTIYSPSAEGSSHNVYIVIQFDGYVSFSAVKDNMRLKHIPCKLASLIGEPAGGYNRKLYEAAGAVYNETTGFYELNGLTDITEEEMMEIYQKTYDGWKTFRFDLNTARTNIPNVSPSFANDFGGLEFNMTRAFQPFSNAEVLKFNTGEVSGSTFPQAIRVSKFQYVFNFNAPLRIVDGVFNVEKETNRIGEYAFSKALETIYLYRCKASVSFKMSPNITVEDNDKSTLGFLVTYAANTDPITITLHADAYARVPETLKQKATAKNISIVSA